MKTVAVIGAGASGLTAIKCCLDEGLEPTCFERTDYIGGLWHYTEEAEEGQACVMKSTVINTSKEMICYSDYPIPKDFPPYLHNKYVEKYFNLYADEFKLRDRIRFNTEILQVKQSKDFDKSGRWDLIVKDKTSGNVSELTFDAVLICTGHHADVNKPTLPGMEKFKGKIVHSHDYKDFHGYEGKRIVVVGVGNSGCDVAVELSRIASQVYLSTRHGAWIFNRVFDQGVPGDMVFSRRFKLWLTGKFPNYASNTWKKKMNDKFDHKTYSLEPEYGPFSAHPTVSDELPNKLIAGSVKVKADIAEFKDTSIEFKDGTVEEDIDAVILATGYIFGFPFLDKSVVDVIENKVKLYKYMFPPQLSRHTLAIIGCFQPLGAIMPICEQQCRLATRIFKKDVTLPPRSEMEADIAAKEIAMSHRYVKSKRHTIQVDYIPFMDELAELNGNKPNLVKLALTDPKLAWECFFGPGTPYQYRLMGPGTWKGARQAIMTQWERTFFPLRTRPLTSTSNEGPHQSSMLYVIVFAVIAILFYFVF